MNAQFEKLQREVDRQLAELAPRLRAPPLPPQRLASLHAAVAAELQRLQRRRRHLAALRPWAAVAAAVLLVVALGRPPVAPVLVPGFDSGESAEAVLADCIDALGESGERFAGLFDEDWLFEGIAPGGEENGAADPLESLEESLEAFEQMIGA